MVISLSTAPFRFSRRATLFEVPSDRRPRLTGLRSCPTLRSTSRMASSPSPSSRMSPQATSQRHLKTSKPSCIPPARSTSVAATPRRLTSSLPSTERSTSSRLPTRLAPSRTSSLPAALLPFCRSTTPSYPSTARFTPRQTGTIALSNRHGRRIFPPLPTVPARSLPKRLLSTTRRSTILRARCTLRR